MIRSERLILVPFEMKYLKEYYDGFDETITRYQWPDPFEGIEAAQVILQQFLDEMKRGETLIFSILSQEGDFLGSVEVHGLAGECPEVGVWIVAAEQNKGYACEALEAVLNEVCEKRGKGSFYWETDIRNAGSLQLLHKLEGKYEAVKQGFEKVTTPSGKELELQGYVLRAKHIP